MIFANIEYLFLLVLLIPYIIWYVMKRKKTEPTLQVSTTRMYMKAPKSWKIYLLHAPFVLRTVAIIMVILILARPQTTDNWQNTEIEGIDIMLAVDVSTSMLAEDLKPNRLEAAKQVASEFINGRPNDNIGLTIFAGESFTQCPLTVDHGVLLNLFNSIKGDIAQRGLIEDGTAIGMGIANAVTRLKDSKAKSKVIILLTDGSNNRGDFSTDGCRDSQTVRNQDLHHRCRYKRNCSLSDADLRRDAICECPRRDRRKDFDRDCRYNERKLFPCHQQFQVEGSLSGDRQTGENEVEREGIQQTRRRISGIRLDCFLLHFA